MKVFIKGLNPCAARRTNLQQYKDYICLNGHEVVLDPLECDFVLIWGCGFRTDYRNNSVEQANYYKNHHKKNVVLAGCIPDIDLKFIEDKFLKKGGGYIVNWKNDEEKMKEIFGTNKTKLNDVSMILGRERLCENAELYKKLNKDKDACYLDEFIQIYVSEGCKLTCSYCSEKLMFPEYNSYPKDEILRTARKLIETQAQDYPNEEEILLMLHADSVGDYGKDIGSNLPELLNELTNINKKVKIGLQGYNPVHFIEYFDKMITLIKNQKIFHIRLPIQSASQKILELMGRKYTINDLQKIFSKFSEIGFKDFSTDVIIGFPGETEYDFNNTIEFILKYRPKYILLSSYMDFERLPSYALPDKVNIDVKKERLMSASKTFIEKGIYCSTDGGCMTDERRRRLNNDYRI